MVQILDYGFNLSEAVEALNILGGFIGQHELAAKVVWRLRALAALVPSIPLPLIGGRGLGKV
jgi:hypothetical protein